MNLEEVFSWIDHHQESYLGRLFEYLRMPSISAHGEGMTEVAGYLLETLTKLGLEAEAVATKGWPVVLGRYNKDPEALTVLLYGHYDVQPPDPLDAWDSPPFEPEIRNGRIYARGVGDNKGQHFAQLLALESLLDITGELPCNVIVMLEGEEEIGSPHLAEFITTHRDKLQADLVITSDGPVHDSGRATLMFGVRGIISFELRAKGANRDLHSGNWGGVAPNPIWTLVQLLATMKNTNGQVTVEGFYDSVLPATPLELEALAKLPVNVERIKQDLGLSQLDAPLERPFYERLSLFPTFTINGFHAGYGGKGSKTVLPHEAFVKCDVRLVEAQNTEDIFKKLERHVAKHAPEVEFKRQGAMEPSKTPIEHPFTQPLLKAIRHAQQDEPLLVPAMGGSLPDYVFTKILGIPAFVVPYANADEANHAPNENLELSRFMKGIKTGAAMLSYLAEHSAKKNP